MRILRAAALVLLSVVPAAADPAAQWWDDVSALAADGMKGRMTGTADYMRAADYVIARMKAEGLKPAGSHGFLQDVAFEQQQVDQDKSRAALTGGQDLAVGDEMLILPGTGPRPAHLDAPLLFLGYGLHLPEQGHDDFAGQDVKGKIVVVLSGGPADISGAVKSNARAARIAQLARRGAAGLITLTTPRQLEILWARQKLVARQPGMYFADRTLRDTRRAFFLASFDPARAQKLFAASGRDFAELCASADASKPLPRFAMQSRLVADIAATRRKIASPNIAAVLEGSDPRLKHEYVAVSAHLDHLGVGEPIAGDTIYNGAIDNASGVASVLGIAHRLKQGPRPRRSILFLLFTGEEKGLLGSHYYALRPTVPGENIVADLNFDMALPLWPLKTIYAPGQEESSLGDDARAVAQARGLTLIADPLPDRNVFIRTDQFSFVRVGIPALVFKFGFALGTPEAAIEHAWRAERYHSPSDDLAQPVLKDEAVKLDAFVAALVSRVANAAGRPQWRKDSIFRP